MACEGEVSPSRAVPSKHFQDVGLLEGISEVEDRGCGSPWSSFLFPLKERLGLPHLLSAVGLVRDHWAFTFVRNLYKHLP